MQRRIILDDFFGIAISFYRIPPTSPTHRMMSRMIFRYSRSLNPHKYRIPCRRHVSSRNSAVSNRRLWNLDLIAGCIISTRSSLLSDKMYYRINPCSPLTYSTNGKWWTETMLTFYQPPRQNILSMTAIIQVVAAFEQMMVNKRLLLLPAFFRKAP